MSLNSKKVRSTLKKNYISFSDRDYRMWMEELRLKFISRFLKLDKKEKTEFGIYALLKHQPVLSYAKPTCTCGKSFDSDELLLDHRVDCVIEELMYIKRA